MLEGVFCTFFGEFIDGYYKDFVKYLRNKEISSTSNINPKSLATVGLHPSINKIEYCDSEVLIAIRALLMSLGLGCILIPLL
jgi:hypothetical protein